MKYLSVCSGIEAASTAWHSLDWTPVAFGEIEPFPCAVLAHHYPDTPNWGDMTKFQEWPDADVDVLVGGTPCQSFSVAGLRKGLADPRGNLMLTYLAIADRYRPTWLVWENVPGVLSSNGGRDFGTFLGGLGELGYGFAYRVLDAQYVRVDSHARAVPQRRRRVFVVGCLGDWRRAAAVLFERESLSGHPAPRRETGQRTAASLVAGAKSSGGIGYDNQALFSQRGDNLIRTADLVAAPHAAISPALKARDSKGVSSDGDGDGAILVPMVTHSLRADGFDASEDGTGRGTPLVPVAMHETGQGFWQEGDIAGTLRAEGENRPSRPSNVVGVPVAFAPQAGGTQTTLGYDPESGICQTLGANQTPAVAFGIDAEHNRREELMGPLQARSGTNNLRASVATSMQVRRLTPMECERLQGFPDNYTAITVKGKPAADGPRYKALGNSMAVNVMRHIGQRIALVESVTEMERAA
jgi:DNA (cytosine-5)-methyltransferase 1